MTNDTLSPDRLLPADPVTRAIARRIHQQVAELPLVAVHGHVPASTIASDEAWPDPATLLVAKDHYVLRVLHSIGVPLDRLLGGDDPRELWRLFCAHWSAFRGTNTRTWMEAELVELFDVALPLSAGNADETYDAIAERLGEPEMRPKALFRRFHLEVLSTTDPPGSDYADHRSLQQEGLAVVPTLRPDSLCDPTRAEWAAAVAAVGVTSYRGLVEHLAAERRRSVEAGAVSTDHGHFRPDTADLGDIEVSAIFDRLAAGRAGPGDAEALSAQLLTVNAVLSLEDGLVMQLHPGVRRDHDRAAKARYGADIGADFPVAASFTENLRPLLERCGNEPGLRLVVFTVDETVYSRELAPLASYWPGVYLGAPWWFLDAPDAMARHFAGVVESAGYAKLTGFVDDTRAYCSIPSRHDVARRVLAGHLARLVAEHRLDEAEAVEVAGDYAYHQPKALYRVGRS
jgi:glucuronate isomerase